MQRKQNRKILKKKCKKNNLLHLTKWANIIVLRSDVSFVPGTLVSWMVRWCNKLNVHRFGRWWVNRKKPIYTRTTQHIPWLICTQTHTHAPWNKWTKVTMTTLNERTELLVLNTKQIFKNEIAMSSGAQPVNGHKKPTHTLIDNCTHNTKLCSFVALRWVVVTVLVSAVAVVTQQKLSPHPKSPQGVLAILLPPLR